MAHEDETVNADSKLFEIEPREQIGAQTGVLYEYQYHQAAAGALKLLDQSENALWIYCEWHDDYVIEGHTNDLYTFYQVKTRSGGPWTVGEFFGLGKLNNKTGIRALSTRQSCVFSNLWDHTHKFGVRCNGFIFLSDTSLDPELQSLLDECKTVDTSDQLSTDSQRLFQSILPPLAKRDRTVTAASLFVFMRKLRAEIGVGTVRNIDDAKLIIADRIISCSEVDLAWSEGRRIGNDLVAIVRSRSHLVLRDLPSTAQQLRSSKAISITDLLKLLSLSEAGYRMLNEGAGDAVKTLSRLHRFCQKRGIAEELIPQLCEFKTTWSSWWLRHSDLLNKTDFIVFKADCIQLLKVHSTGNMGLEELGRQAKVIAAKYNLVLNPIDPLTEECVFGFLISLAVDAER
jgi:hypothetical protein